jgi:ABC-2 type transport system ATP-binding protein
MKTVINNLSKTYRQIKALDSVSLEIGDGIYGLLGSNGAGKSTLLKILATLETKSEGSVLIDGIDIDNKKGIREIVGFIPQSFSSYPSLSVYEALDYLALLSLIKPTGKRKSTILELLEKVNLQNHLKTKVITLSEAMKKRFGIAQAMLHSPKLILADEPVAGLDIEESNSILSLLQYFSSDRSIIISTDSVSDIQNYCTDLALLKNGSVLFNGSIGCFLDQLGCESVSDNTVPASIKINDVYTMFPVRES